MRKPIIKFIKVHPNAQTPTQANPGDAGYDLYAVEDVWVYGSEVQRIRTGLKISIPKGYYVEIHPRSSWDMKATKTRIGIIDEGYQGEMDVLTFALICPQFVKKGDRIGQLIIRKRYEAEFKEVKEFKKKTKRGSKGFGSTGKD